MQVRDSSGRALLPVQGGSMIASDVELGWKAPALLLAPMWMLVSPPLLPLLLLAWLKLPNTGRGQLEWDLYVDSISLNRGLWRFMLGLVLDGIGRSSLPAMLNSLDGGVGNLPRSLCTGVSVAKKGGKLVLDGQLQRFATRRLDRSVQTGQELVMVGPLDYTLRMGLRPGRVAKDGTVVEPDTWSARGRPSCLVWDTPELQLSLGDSGLARLLPQLWVPVAASCCVALPRALELRRAVVSQAGDAVSAAGTLALQASSTEEDGSFALTTT